MEGTAPRSVNYADTLPLAVSSTQNRRSYYPQNGQSFTDTSNNIIRIDVNADGLLDAQQSYLEFTLTNNADSSRAFDQGHPWIKRLTIESAGVVLEDINNYNRLVGGILQPAQGSAAYTGEIQVSQMGGAGTDNKKDDATVNAFGVPYFQNRLASLYMKPDGSVGMTAQDASNATGVVAKDKAFTGQYHLVCGFLNMDKYIPLFLMGQGFTIQIELANGVDIGIVDTGKAAPYTITNVRYVGHIVDMQRDFYDMLRNMQAQSGGSLMIGGSTFRHFSHAYTPAAGGTENVNISARVRSLENLLFVGNETANITNENIYKLSTGSNLGFKDGGAFNVFVGSVRYPSNQISVDPVSNKGQAYQELRKCFGALGSINHGGLLNNVTYLSNDNGTGVDGRSATHGANPCYAPLGISFKSWRHELEDGIDTSSQALPIRLELQSSTAGGATTLDIYAQATILFYFNMDGSCTASV